MLGQTQTAPPAARRSRGRRPAPRWQLVAVGAICLASAVGVVLGDHQPTGSPLADVLWEALLGAAVPLAASRSRRWALLLMGGVTAVAASGATDILIAMLALTAALAMTVFDRRHRVVGALVGAACIQVLAGLPDLGFHGASALVVAVAIVPLLVSGLGNTRRRWRRLITLTSLAVVGLMLLLSAAVALAALASRDDIEAGIDDALAGLDAAAAGDDQLAVERLRAAADRLDGAAQLVGSPLLAPATGVPVIGQHQRALEVGTETAHGLAVAAADAADAIELDGLRPIGGRIDLDVVRSIEPPLADAVDTLERALGRLDDTHSPWIVGPLSERLGDLESDVATTLPDARTALSGARAAPAMLGGDGPRRWLVLFTTPAETRLLGGFVGNWAVLEADDGAVELVASGAAREVNAGPGAAERQIDGPQEFLDRYARYTPNSYFHNVTASPHFPSSAQVAASFYEQSMREEIDGVIAVDPLALGSLADLVGGVPGIPGRDGPLDGDALAQLLLVDGYELDALEQEEIFLAAAEATFDAVMSGTLPGPSGIADRMSPFVHQRRLMMWSEHEAEQELLSHLGLDASLPPADGRDVLLVGMANNNPNKIDVYIDRDIDHDVRYDPATGITEATTTATFTNTAPLDLPDVVVYSPEDLPRGTARSFITLYSPLALDELRIGGEQVPVEAQLEQGLNAYSLRVDIPPNGALTLTWSLRGTLDAGGYELTQVTQPLVRPADLRVAVTSTGQPWRPLRADAPAGLTVDDATATFTGQVATTVDLDLRPLR